jgi:hypothetical protein
MNAVDELLKVDPSAPIDIEHDAKHSLYEKRRGTSESQALLELSARVKSQAAKLLARLRESVRARLKPAKPRYNECSRALSASLPSLT